MEYHSDTIIIHIIEEIRKFISLNHTHFKTTTTIIGSNNFVILFNNHLHTFLEVIKDLSNK